MEPTDGPGLARTAGVLERVRRAADGAGFLRFDRFMEIALYDPEVGYYSSPRSPLGRTGDFYTAAHASPLFAATIAERLRAIRATVGDPFRIVELGPGDGTLAAGVARALGAAADGLEYALVDRSGARLDEAESRVRSSAPGLRVRRAISVGADGPFRGAVVANEFLDAVPARRLRWDVAGWRELGVRLGREGLEMAESPDPPVVSGRELPTASEPGTILECSPEAEGSVREIADHLVAGAAILIDYGAEESELLAAHPGGTLAAVRGHRALPNPLETPGLADLSTFVNFSRVREAARRAGLVEVRYTSQAEALGAWGLPGLLDAAVRSAGSAEEEVRRRLAAKNLLFGFGQFRALELAPPSGPATPR